MFSTEQLSGEPYPEMEIHQREKRIDHVLKAQKTTTRGYPEYLQGSYGRAGAKTG